MDLQNGEFELPSCIESLNKNKTIKSNLSNNLVTNFENHTPVVLDNSISSNLDTPLNTINENISTAVNNIDQKKYLSKY